MTDFEFELLSWTTILLMFITISVSLFLILEYIYLNPSILDRSLQINR